MTEQPPPGSVPPGSPPPGSPPPGSPPPGSPYGQPGYSQPYPQPYPPGYPPAAPYQFAPAHKPGIIALRPLGLGDFFDGAFKLIRRNPKPMIGLAAMVTAAFMVIPAIITLALAATGDLSLGTTTSPGTDPFGETTETQFGSGEVGTLIAIYSGSVLGVVATIILNGLIVPVVAGGVLGEKVTIGGAWQAARGRLLHLIGLTLLNSLVAVLLVGIVVGLVFAAGAAGGTAAGVIVGILGGLLVLVALIFIQTRYFQLAAPAMILERSGVFSAIGRAFELSRQQFWRLFGIYLLTSLLVGVVGSVLGLPFSMLGVIGPLISDDPTVVVLMLAFSSYLAQIIVGAVTTPFTSAVVALQYVDQRIRKEGFDVDLINRAQQTTQTLF